MQFSLITEQHALDEAIRRLQKQSVIAIDTEFMRRRTLYPELALIQVYDGDTVVLIDPLCELELSSFWSLMTDQRILKIVHSPSEDLEVFLKHGQCVPVPLFDTQFALSVLGERNCVGFASMVEMLLNENIDKSESRTNWLQRPLTESQLNYAAADVYYLLPCFEIIKSKLSSQQHAIVLSECALLANKRAFKKPATLAYLDIKNAWQLKPKQLAVLRELAAWRQERAEHKNLALNFVVKEQILFDIAKMMPTHFGALKHICKHDQMVINRYGKTLLTLVKRGNSVEESKLPDKVTRLIDYSGYKKALKEIRDKLEIVASEQGIPLEVIASKKQINQLITWKWKLSNEIKTQLLPPDLLTGWRQNVIKNTLKEWQ